MKRTYSSMAFLVATVIGVQLISLGSVSGQLEGRTIVSVGQDGQDGQDGLSRDGQDGQDGLSGKVDSGTDIRGADGEDGADGVGSVIQGQFIGSSP
jgi:hypothetical protein